MGLIRSKTTSGIYSGIDIHATKFSITLCPHFCSGKTNVKNNDPQQTLKSFMIHQRKIDSIHHTVLTKARMCGIVQKDFIANNFGGRITLFNHLTQKI